jgi:hypothetical protein
MMYLLHAVTKYVLVRMGTSPSNKTHISKTHKEGTPSDRRTVTVHAERLPGTSVFDALGAACPRGQKRFPAVQERGIKWTIQKKSTTNKEIQINKTMLEGRVQRLASNRLERMK